MHLSVTRDPGVALALAAFGTLGVYFECCAPGRIAPGVAGLLLATAGIASLAALPIRLPGLAAIALAFVLFLLEAVFVTRGPLTLLGAAAMFAGARLLVATPRVSWIAAAVVALVIAPVTSFLFSAAVRAHRNKAIGNANDILKQTSGMLNHIRESESKS